MATEQLTHMCAIMRLSCLKWLAHMNRLRDQIETFYENGREKKTSAKDNWFSGKRVCVCVWVSEWSRDRFQFILHKYIIENRRWSNDDDDVNRWPKSQIRKTLSTKRPWRFVFVTILLLAVLCAAAPPVVVVVVVDNSFAHFKFELKLKLKLVQNSLVVHLPSFWIFQKKKKKSQLQIVNNAATIAIDSVNKIDVRACHCASVRVYE